MIEDKIKHLINLPDTYIGEAPIAVDSCQWIRTAAGSSNVYFTKETFDRPALSIYVRDKQNGKALERCQRLFNLIRNYTDSGCAILAKRLPSFVGKDEKHRSVYTFQIEYQTGGY